MEILRHTGIRIEELLELSHQSIISYRLPTTSQVIPLLQIAPSKTDRERLLLVSPELADVLSAVVARVRAEDGIIPAIPSYDVGERVWNPPIPLLFQYVSGDEHVAFTVSFVRKALDETLEDSGLTDTSGAPLRFQPLDFRRIFITDAVLNGLPPHIAQVIAGHKDIHTTMGYAAIYPKDAIEAHRAFLARRRALRLPEEYRVVTPEEWDEFLGHFERRKLALGECGRAYGSDCVHEHACVRCPVLIVSPAERPRLVEIRDNLSDRIAEAQREGWLGEVEGLSTSLAAAREKIGQLDRQQEGRASQVFIGIPTFDQIVARASQTREP
ncbi:site-specific integrase [Streptomyces flavofungini]|uniref:site-specific integrase n=1 Tax=Streptomyces flavofungini TaxID=68200 RepID=UPI0025B239B5|nr:site-specific integrase [Streptomyces flavofungini]WJV44526.1 site-specific integrase [Streptomyces flavofungini]